MIHSSAAFTVVESSGFLLPPIFEQSCEEVSATTRHVSNFWRYRLVLRLQ